MEEKNMNIRKLLFCILIPAISSFWMGAWFTLHGVSNIGILALIAIISFCAWWGYYARGGELAWSIAEWSLELFTGFLYIKILAGILGEFGALVFILVLALFVIMVIFTIKHGKNVAKLAGIRKRAKTSKDNGENLEQPVERVEAEEVQQTSGNEPWKKDQSN